MTNSTPANSNIISGTKARTEKLTDSALETSTDADETLPPAATAPSQSAASEPPLRKTSLPTLPAKAHAIPSTPFSPPLAASTPRPCSPSTRDKALENDRLSTPGKKVEGSQALKTIPSRVGSSPTRCSPSKRSSPFSSSSPTRSGNFDSAPMVRSQSIRPARSRSRMSSETHGITEGLACTTVRCDSDADHGVTLSEKGYQGVPGKGESVQFGFGLSALQVVKMGLSKYTPLLKPQWLMSDPTKADSAATMAVEAGDVDLQRGHRRSKPFVAVDFDDFGLYNQQTTSLPVRVTVFDSPPLTAKEDGSKLVACSLPFTPLSTCNSLGPAFGEERPSLKLGSIHSGLVRIPLVARATRGRVTKAYQMPTVVPQQSPTARAALSSKRNKNFFASPSSSQLVSGKVKVKQSKDGVLHLKTDASPISTKMGGLGIVCAQKEDKSLQSPLSSFSSRKGSFDTVASMECPDSPAYSASSVPSIIVTPPAALSSRMLHEREKRVPRDGVRLDYFAEPSTVESKATSGFEVVVQQDSLEDERRGATPQQPSLVAIASTDGLPISPVVGAATESDQSGLPSPSVEACEIRNREDERGMAAFKIAIDALLSEYFVFRTVSRTWRLARQMVYLVQCIFDPLRCYSNTDDVGRMARRGEPTTPPLAACSHDQHSVCIPSLRGQKWIGEGDQAMEVSAEWAVSKMQTMTNQVMEHVVSGMVALVTDERAPYETPAALAQLCLALQQELPSLADIHSKADAPRWTARAKRNSPVTDWAKSCASAQSSSPLTDAMSEGPETSTEGEAAWRQALGEIDPGATFTLTLHQTIQTSLDKGETIRSKATLLAVPPPRKGSRKRWQAANAEVNALRAVKEQDFSQVTRGLISESEFRKRERKRAAVGSTKDVFAVFFFVRFVGELYNSKVVDVGLIRQWLQRYFFNTVYPGVPSSYELEAGCALLITVGATLDREAGIGTAARKQVGPYSSPSPARAEDEKRDDHRSVASMEEHTATTVAGRAATRPGRADDVPANHWILVSPKAVREMHASCSPHGLLLKDEGEEQRGGCEESGSSSLASGSKDVASRTITATMARLCEIIAIREVDPEGRVWCREVIGLRNRNWQQGDTASSHKMIALRKFKRDLWGP